MNFNCRDIVISIIAFVMMCLNLNGQQNIFYNPELIAKIWSDTVPKEVEHNKRVKALVASMESDKGRIDKMFPYCKPDSVVAYDFNKKYRKTEHIEDAKEVFKNGKVRKDLELINGTSLNSNCIQQLTEFVTLPTNFTWSNCGTPIPFGLIAFYKRGKIKALVILSCGGLRQFECYPSNKRIKFGGIDEDKFDWWREFQKQFNVYKVLTD